MDDCHWKTSKNLGKKSIMWLNMNQFFKINMWCKKYINFMVVSITSVRASFGSIVWKVWFSWRPCYNVFN
jgi:hypothetical protein